LIPGNYGQFLLWSGILLVAIFVLLLVPILGDRKASGDEVALRGRRATSGTA
jgi:hypothetical protein